jgi:tetratricopeptide (TPR) repeat protein
MRAVFDHSWKMLSEEQQRALRQFSAFRGGFRREAAREVADADLMLISSLLAKSFLRRTSAGRFMMHDLVRHYAAGKLAENPEEERAVTHRHGAYYLTFVARFEGDLRGARQREALTRIDAEAGNIRRAWLQTGAFGDPAIIRQPIPALWSFFDIRGWFQEAQTAFGWAADTLEQRFPSLKAPEQDITALHAYLHAQQGWFLLRIGRFEEAARNLAVSLEVLREAGAYGFLVDALQHAGALERLKGNYRRSRELFQEMYDYARQINDPWNATIAEGNIGLADQALGATVEAKAHMANTVISFRAIGDARMLAVALHFLGGISCVMGSLEEAGDYLRESLTLSRAVNDRWVESMALRELGNVARETGRHQEAASLFTDSLALAREIDEHWSLLQALNCLGATMLTLGDLDAAHDAFAEALTMAWEMQALPDVLAALAGLAEWSTRRAAIDEQLQSALTTTLFVLSHPATAQRTKDAALQLQSELQERLEPGQVQAARVLAETISLEALVAGPPK